MHFLSDQILQRCCYLLNCDLVNFVMLSKLLTIKLLNSSSCALVVFIVIHHTVIASHFPYCSLHYITKVKEVTNLVHWQVHFGAMTAHIKPIIFTLKLHNVGTIMTLFGLFGIWVLVFLNIQSKICQRMDCKESVAKND